MCVVVRAHKLFILNIYDSERNGTKHKNMNSSGAARKTFNDLLAEMSGIRVPRKENRSCIEA